MSRACSVHLASEWRFSYSNSVCQYIYLGKGIVDVGSHDEKPTRTVFPTPTPLFFLNPISFLIRLSVLTLNLDPSEARASIVSGSVRACVEKICLMLSRRAGLSSTMGFVDIPSSRRRRVKVRRLSGVPVAASCG
jgi:hypothetical protein